LRMQGMAEILSRRDGGSCQSVNGADDAARNGISTQLRCALNNGYQHRCIVARRRYFMERAPSSNEHSTATDSPDPEDASSEAVQQSRRTRRRARRLNRCRPSTALDEHRHDHGDNNDGVQSMAAQNNNQHRQYVSFSRKIGRFTESRLIEFTQMRLDADRKETTNDDRKEATEAQRKAEKYQSIARKLKVTWRSRVTGVHPLSTFMRIEASRLTACSSTMERKGCIDASTRTIRGLT